MPIFLCENPECGNFHRGETDEMCRECGHMFVDCCRKCQRPITGTSRLKCWACGASYKLCAPLPVELLVRRWEQAETAAPGGADAKNSGDE